MNINKKKGIQLNQAFGAVLAVVLVAILVIVAIFLFDVLSTSFPTTTTAVTNEAGIIDEAGYRLDATSECNFGSPAITLATNSTSGQTILVGNYTLSSTGLVTNATTLEWEAVNFNYTYTSGGDSCDAAQATVTQFATYPALVGLVGTIVFLGLVIGVLVFSFIFGGKRREV